MCILPMSQKCSAKNDITITDLIPTPTENNSRDVNQLAGILGYHKTHGNPLIRRYLFPNMPISGKIWKELYKLNLMQVKKKSHTVDRVTDKFIPHIFSAKETTD